MSPIEQQQSPSDESTKEWFKTIDAPSVIQQSLGSKPKDSKKKGIIVVLAVIIFIVAGFAVWTIVRPAALACLSQEDYEIFTGAKPDSQLSSIDAFYTQTVRFVHESDKYSGDSEKTSSAMSKKIGQFYEKRSKASSLVITISSDYTSDEAKDLADKRATKLKSLLVRNGIEENAISISEPQQIISDGELSIEPEDQPTVTAYISLTSDANCVEK